MEPKLIIHVRNPANKLVEFHLFKGAKLDASIIGPKQLMKLHSGVLEEPELDERIENQILKGVMGECTMDISGTCTIQNAVDLIRALHHRQEVKINFFG